MPTTEKIRWTQSEAEAMEDRLYLIARVLGDSIDPDTEGRISLAFRLATRLDYKTDPKTQELRQRFGI